MCVGCEDGSVDLYVTANTSQGWKLLTTVKHEGPVTACAFSPVRAPVTLMTVSRGSNPTLCKWQMDENRTQCTLAFSTAAQSGYNICTRVSFLVEPSAGGEPMPSQPELTFLAPLGKDGSNRGVVCVFNELGEVVGGFKAHTNNVRACQASKDGAVVVTCCSSDGAKVWRTPAAAMLAKRKADAERMKQMEARFAAQEKKEQDKRQKEAAALKAAEEKKRRKKEKYEAAKKESEAEAKAKQLEEQRAAAEEAERAATAAKMAAAMAETEAPESLSTVADVGKEHRRKKKEAKRRKKAAQKKAKQDAEAAERAAEIDALM